MKCFFSLILTISCLCLYSQTITTSTLPTSTFCQNETVNVSYTITGSFGTSNIFTAQLSDELGSFIAPTNIGSISSNTSGTIVALLPPLLNNGTQYRIRVISDNPGVIGSDNGTDIQISGNSTSPSIFGNNVWNSYCYNIATYTNNTSSMDYSDYKGMYTISTLDYNSSDLWATNGTPSDAQGYIGCEVTSDQHIVQSKRKGFPCGYYSISIAGPGNLAGHDDAARLIVDGNVVWSNSGCCQQRLDIYTGFLGPYTEVEFTWSDNWGLSYGRLTFESIDFPIINQTSLNICPGSSAILEATGATNYDWSTNTTHLIAPFTNATVECSPSGSTPISSETYTVSTTDATTGCTVSNTVNVDVDPAPSVSITPTSGSYCGSGSVDISATGAYTYTWSPNINVTVNSTNSNLVTLSPSTTTTYTVTGNNNCSTDHDSVTITVLGPNGNPNDFGINTWNVYCYNGNNFNTHYGEYVHNTLDFDTRNVWNQNGSPSDAPGYNGCTIPNDQHSFKYKRKGFDCGYYRLGIPIHDDYVEVILDGITIFSQNSWYANVAKPNIWQGYLDEDSEIEYTIREFGGGSNGSLTFDYLFGPNNANNETVWNGRVSNDWFDPNNWCSDIPSSTISAIIPEVGTNYPVINGSVAHVANIEVKENASLTTLSSGSLDVYGDFKVEGTYDANNGTISFSGSDTTFLSSSDSELTFHNITFNKSNGASVVLGNLYNDKINIEGTALFTIGILSAGSNLVEFRDNSSAVSAKDISHVDGKVRKVGDDSFEFPVGKSGFFRAISINQPALITDHFTAEFFDSTPNGIEGPGIVNIEAPIQNISDCEYWILDRTNGSSSVNVTLSYRNYGSNGCSGVTDLSTLSISRWDSTSRTWTYNQGTATTLPDGTITTNNPISTFSPFTFGTSTGGSELPIELLSFEASKNKFNKVDLEWETASEINNDYFELLRSKDGVKFDKIGQVQGAGNSSETLSYSFTDETPLTGTSYYQLVQYDFDGSYTKSHVAVVNIISEDGFSVFPNPLVVGTDELNIKADGWSIENLTIHNGLGEIVLEKEVNQSNTSINTDYWSPGVYFLRASNGNTSISRRIVILSKNK